MEHVGHAGHADHDDAHEKKGTAKAIGVTMALLGVLLALCAAMVGSARTELIRATVEQSNRWSQYQSESTKYRVMLADYEMLHALTPNKAELKTFEERIAKVKAKSGRGDDEDTTEIKEAIHVSTAELADLLAPDHEDEQRLLGLAGKYKRDMAEAKEDAEAYDLLIDAHHEAAEWYERAQLAAEIGIVVASVALLLSSRAVWLVAVVIGMGGLSSAGYNFVHTRAKIQVAELHIEHAKKSAAVMTNDDGADEGSDHGPAPGAPHVATD